MDDAHRQLLQHEVAGLRCVEVLAALSEYFDGELDRDRADALETHVTGCDHCARFGGRFAKVVGSLRQALRGESTAPADGSPAAEPAPLAPPFDPARRTRLHARLFGRRSGRDAD